MNDIVNRIANGQATLLGIEDICTRLGISRTTFDRWVRNGGGKAGPLTGAQLARGGIIGSVVQDFSANSTEGNIKFPPPDIRIGNSPKWEMETFKRWLTENAQPGK
jgi:hypothetical protein